MNDASEFRTIAFVNARVAGSELDVLRIRGAHIVSVGLRAQQGDHVVDLQGERLMPGLINSHEHLHRNHYPRLKFRAQYDSAVDWAADIDARRGFDADLIAGAAVPRAASFIVGGLKNLLSGATTVVHHDSPSPEHTDSQFPVHALTRLGWAHSLSIDGPEGVRESHGATPPDMPWFIHAGEGTHSKCAEELDELDALGVLTANTVLVHGVAFDAAARARLVERQVGLVWCPGSNQFLYGRAAGVGDLVGAGLLALGSDSRLSGERDLLDELRFARSLGQVDDDLLETLVTSNAARLLRLTDRGTLCAGAIADLIVLPRDARLWEVRRSDLRCVIAAGQMRCGDDDYAERLLKPESRVTLHLDGVRKCVSEQVADLFTGLPVREPGVELASGAAKAA
jgi:cytosine/adenosine deaminase-related metal-dependent hydrolase